jgi:hypothetical protein
VPVSQSPGSATERSRTPSQCSTAISNRQHPALQPPIDRTNAATQPNLANLVESQNASSAAQAVDSTERPVRRAAAHLESRRTVPPIDPAIAQISQPITQRTQAALPTSLRRRMALGEERMIQRTNSTVVRTAPAGKSSQTASSSSDVQRPATGTEFPASELSVLQHKPLLLQE